MQGFLILWMPATFVWLCAYSHGKRRVKLEDGRRERCWLDKHLYKHWFGDSSQVPMPLWNQASSSIKVTTLAEISPVATREWNSDFRHQTEFLWEYLKRPLDAITIAVKPIALVSGDISLLQWHVSDPNAHDIRLSHKLAQWRRASVAQWALVYAWKQFDPNLLYSTVSDCFFRCYMEFVLLVNAAVAECMAWMEYCPCHLHVWVRWQGRPPREVVESEFGPDSDNCTTCPYRGCMAWFLADDGVWRLLDCIFATIFHKMAVWRPRLSGTQWCTICKEWARIKAHLIYHLTSKLNVWRELPWKLCALAHPSLLRARAAAEEVMRLFDMAPTEEAAHHPLSWLFLNPRGELRPLLQMFKDGVSLHCQRLRKLKVQIAKLLFVMVAERSIERPHSLVSTDVAFKNIGPVSVSTAARAPEIQKLFGTDPAMFEKLVQYMDKTRSVSRIPGLLDLDQHPWIKHAKGQKCNNSKMAALVSRVVYRADLVPLRSMWPLRDYGQGMQVFAPKTKHVRQKLPCVFR